MLPVQTACILSATCFLTIAAVAAVVATPAAAQETNVLIPTQDEAITIVQASPSGCAGAGRGETGLRFRYGRAAVYRQRVLLFDGGSGPARHLLRVCLTRQKLATGETRVSQGSVALYRRGETALLLSEGQCLLITGNRLSIALTGLPVVEAGGKQEKRRLSGALCLRKERR